MNPEPLEHDDWECDQDLRTGERRIVVPPAPSEREERTTLVDELREPFSAHEREPMPTHPDLGPPPLPPSGLLESYVSELEDDEDLRDTIPAPVPPEEL